MQTAVTDGRCQEFGIVSPEIAEIQVSGRLSAGVQGLDSEE